MIGNLVENTATIKKSLGTIRRKAVDLSHFNPVRESQLSEGEPLPLIMEPAADQVDLADWARNNRDYINAKLQKHGGILFRGFGLSTPPKTSSASPLRSTKKSIPNTAICRVKASAGKIYHSTPYPADKTILYHNESSHMNAWPTRISFFCVTAAKEGGCSPVVDCRKVYRELDPAVREKFEKIGLMYIRNFSDGLDVSWRHFFQTEDRAVVEKRAASRGSSRSGTGKTAFA